MRLRAHFDGRVIVPDEPVNLPVDEPLSVQVDVNSSTLTIVEVSLEEQQAAFERLLSRPIQRTTPIPDEALRRENMYADDDEQQA